MLISKLDSTISLDKNRTRLLAINHLDVQDFRIIKKVNLIKNLMFEFNLNLNLDLRLSY
jgi:hypothetical protein